MRSLSWSLTLVITVAAIPALAENFSLHNGDVREGMSTQEFSYVAHTKEYKTNPPKKNDYNEQIYIDVVTPKGESFTVYFCDNQLIQYIQTQDTTLNHFIGLLNDLLSQGYKLQEMEAEPRRGRANASIDYHFRNGNAYNYRLSYYEWGQPPGSSHRYMVDVMSDRRWELCGAW